MNDLTVACALDLVDRLAPFRLAESWDNVGLQVGDPAKRIRAVGVALDATPQIVKSCRRHRIDLLIVHHPLIFKPVSSVSRETTTGAVISDLIVADVALIAAHTNLDVSPHGTNAALAELLGLKERGAFIELPAQPADYKFVVFVPVGHERAALEAIARGGGGVIGDYDRCSFRSVGAGTYRPLKGAQPFAGQVGRVEEADELRIEAVVPRSALPKVLREVLAAHPYEEVAYDIYPRDRIEVVRRDSSGSAASLGLTGAMPRAMSLATLARKIKGLLPGAEPVAVVGDPKTRVARLAVFSGSGSMAIEQWRGQADALLTGELGYHEAREAEARGIPVVVAGHFATEQPVVPFFAKRLGALEEIRSARTRVVALEGETSPLVKVS